MLQLLLAILTTLVLWTAYSLWIKKQPTPNPNDSQRSSQTEQQQPKQQISSEPVTKPEPKQETTTTEQPQIIQPTPSAMDTFVKQVNSDKDWQQKLQTKKPGQKNEMPRGYGKKVINERWKIVTQSPLYKDLLKERAKNTDPLKDMVQLEPQKELLDDMTYQRSDLFKDNIENFIGTVKVPVGIAGPVRVNGLHAQGDFYVPLATTEAALVASLSRGISAINQAGGATSVVILEGVSRDPCFVFKNLIEVGTFLAWAGKEFANFKKVAEKSTRFGKLIDLKYTVEGNNVHMKCQYTSGDASGQNIVTIASENIVNYIMENTPVKPAMQLLEGGMSGDKKANHLVMNSVRGKRVVAEVVLSRAIVETTLHSTPEQIYNAGAVGTRGVVLTGAIGHSAHFSNAITALAIALGQDPACAAEAHVGIARVEITPEKDLYMSGMLQKIYIILLVTLPNLLVASIGGGTKLPSQRACLELMGLYGPGKANALAEVIAVICIAGELSLGSAIVTGDFAKAHKILARDTSLPINLNEDTLDEAFDKAQAMLVKLNNVPDKDSILDVYGLYKQATVGDVNVSKPSFFSIDIKSKTKYQAWEKFKGLNKDNAMKEYVKTVLKLVEADKKASA